jgi:hypothetical protein
LRHTDWAFGPTSSRGNAQRDLALRHILDNRMEAIVDLAAADHCSEAALLASQGTWQPWTIEKGSPSSRRRTACRFCRCSETATKPRAFEVLCEIQKYGSFAWGGVNAMKASQLIYGAKVNRNVLAYGRR